MAVQVSLFLILSFHHDSFIYRYLFSQEGETVEFEINEDESGKRSAQGVTGPEGAYVQGAPRKNYDDYNSDY